MFGSGNVPHPCLPAGREIGCLFFAPFFWANKRKEGCLYKQGGKVVAAKIFLQTQGFFFTVLELLVMVSQLWLFSICMLSHFT
jgi:hypothetical protein